MSAGSRETRSTGPRQDYILPTAIRASGASPLICTILKTVQFRKTPRDLAEHADAFVTHSTGFLICLCHLRFGLTYQWSFPVKSGQARC